MRFKKFAMGGKLPLLYLFLAGALLGILLINLGKAALLEHTGLLNEEALYHMKYMTVDGHTLFWYVLGIRVKHLLILAVLSTTYLGLAAVCSAVVGYGATAGMFLAVAMIRYGLKGVLLVITAVFPQCLLYVPGFFFLMVWCEQTCRFLYFEKGARLGNKKFLLVKLLQCLGVMVVVIVGCVLESYVNPVIFKKMLKIF